MQILVQRHNYAIFLRKWARWGRYSQWRSLSGNVQRIFVHKNWRGGYWQHMVSTGRRYVTHSLYSMFCALFLKIALSAAELMSFDHLEAAIWHRWTIICVVPSKISVTLAMQLHTIDNVLKNCIDRVGYSWPTEAAIWMKLFSIINRKDCTFK